MSEEVKTEGTQENTGNEQVNKPAEKTYSEAEYNALAVQLEEFKKASAENENFKEKWEQSEAARKDFEYRTKVSSFVKALNLKDDIYEKHVENLIIEKELKFEDNKLIGGDDVVNSFRATHADAFRPNMTEGVSAPTSGNTPAVMDDVTKAFLAKNPHIKL